MKCFPRHVCVSGLGAVSAEAPHAMHQNTGSLTTIVCCLPAGPAARMDALALAVQASVAGPWDVLGASLLQVSVLARQTVQCHPVPRRLSVWPPSLGGLALTVHRLPD